MLRAVITSVLLLQAMCSLAQQSFINPAYTYVYKLDSAQTQFMYLRQKVDTTWLYMRRIDSFQATQPRLPYGTYLFAKAFDRNVAYSVVNVPFAEVKLLAFNKMVQLRLYDTLERTINNARLICGDVPIAFDTSCGCFELPVSTHTRNIYIEHNGNFIFSKIGPEMSPGNYEDNSVSSFSIPRITHGYFIVNQPKYLPGDTVKLKAYILKANHKPLKKALQLNLYGGLQNYEVMLAKVKPVTPGAYVYQFRIPDSLKIDRDYRLEFRTRDGSKLKEAGFRLEEYKLRNNTYEAMPEKVQVYKGEQLKFLLKAKDANGLPVPDARAQVKIRLINYSNFSGKMLFIPDAWQQLMYTTTTELDMSGVTEVVVPPEVFPDMDMDLHAEITFSSASGELKVFEFNVKVHCRKDYYRLFNNNTNYTINAAYINAGSSSHSKAILKGSYLYATRFSDTLSVPFEKDIDPLNDTYTLYDTAGNEISSVAVPVAEPAFVGDRTHDTITMELNNPYHLLVNYRIYKDDVLVYKGKGTRFSYAECDTTYKSYNVIYSYMLRGNEVIRESVFTFKKQALDVSTTLPAVVFPGQTVAVDVKVTDRDRKAARKVNLTAYALNAQFENLSAPYLKYYGEPKDKILKYLNTRLVSPNLLTVSGNTTVSYTTLLYAGLIYPADYRLLHPGDSIFMNYEKIKYRAPEIHALVLGNGKPVPVYAAYVDDEPVYCEGGIHPLQPVFVVEQGWHKISLRTATATYILKPLYFADSNRYVLSFDTLCLSATLQKKIEKTRQGLSDTERVNFNRHTLQFEPRYRFMESGEVLLVQGQNIRPLSEPLYETDMQDEKSFRQFFYGPFRFDTIHVYVNGGDSLSFLFEPGYRYICFNNAIMREPVDSIFEPFEMRFFRGADAGLNTLTALPKRLVKPVEQKTDAVAGQVADAAIPQLSEACLDNYFYEPDYSAVKKMQSLVLLSAGHLYVRNLRALNRQDELRSLVSNTSVFNNDHQSQETRDLQLDTGVYDLYFTSARMNRVATFKSFKIAANGVTLLRLDSTDFQGNCTNLVSLIPLLKNLDLLYKDRNNNTRAYRIADYVRVQRAVNVASIKANERHATLSGYVYDDAGNTLENVVITLEQGDAIRGISFTDGTGGFVIRSLATGTYKLRLSRFGSCITILTDIQLRNGITSEMRLRLKECGFSTFGGNISAAVYESVSAYAYKGFSNNEIVNKTGFGEIRGRVLEAHSKTPVDHARIAVFSQGVEKGKVFSDKDGNFVVSNLKPGEYYLGAFYVGYAGITINNIEVIANESRYVNFTMRGTMLQQVVVTAPMPVFYEAAPHNEARSSVEIMRLPARSVNKVSGTIPGVDSRSGGYPNIRGSRSDGTAYYIDGIRVNAGATGLPSSSIDMDYSGEIRPPRFEGMDRNTMVAMLADNSINKTRETFRDYAYWEPNMVTDKHGMAHYSITFPDNITRWRNFIMAMNTNLHTAVLVYDTRSYKPLVANLFLPGFALAGDSIRIKGRVANYTGEAFKITTSFSLSDSVKSTRSIMVKEVFTDALWVQPVKTDTFKYTYALQTDFGYIDGEKYLLPVLRNGTVLNQFKYYSLPTDTTIRFVADSAAESNLVLMDNYTQLIRDEIARLQQYNYGCAEQTTSKLKALLVEKRLDRLLADSFKNDYLVKVCIRKLEAMQQADGS